MHISLIGIVQKTNSNKQAWIIHVCRTKLYTFVIIAQYIEIGVFKKWPLDRDHSLSSEIIDMTRQCGSFTAEMREVLKFHGKVCAVLSSMLFHCSYKCSTPLILSQKSTSPH